MTVLGGKFYYPQSPFNSPTRPSSQCPLQPHSGSFSNLAAPASPRPTDGQPSRGLPRPVWTRGRGFSSFIRLSRESRMVSIFYRKKQSQGVLEAVRGSDRTSDGVPLTVEGGGSGESPC